MTWIPPGTKAYLALLWRILRERPLFESRHDRRRRELGESNRPRKDDEDSMTRIEHCWEDTETGCICGNGCELPAWIQDIFQAEEDRRISNA